MEFEWDENKRKSNIDKHGIDFQDALHVFYDMKRIEYADDRKDYGELRMHVIGVVNSEIIILVVYTDRDSSTRIISARRANKKEKRKYKWQSLGTPWKK